MGTRLNDGGEHGAAEHRQRMSHDHEIMASPVDGLHDFGARGNLLDAGVGEEFMEPVRDERARRAIGVDEKNLHSSSFQTRLRSSAGARVPISRLTTPSKAGIVTIH